MHSTSLRFSKSLLPTMKRFQHKPKFISSSNTSNPFPSFGFLLSPLSISTIGMSPSISRKLFVKCSSEERESMGMRDLVSGLVDKQVQDLMNREENRVLFDGLEKATQRVEMARKELAEIERQEKEASQLKDYVGQLENRTSEIAESQRELLEARAMVEQAELSLSSTRGWNRSGDSLENNESQEIDKDVERLESIKAAFVSAVVGTLAGLPISFSQATGIASLILHLGVIFISCALFGVTFRYTIRRDLDNIQLKTGTSAAFSFVKGLAELEAGEPLEFNTGSFISHAIDGAVYVSENFFIFIFASIGLDYCFKMGLLSPFPIRKSVSQSNLR
ncbi:homer protein [Tasmannia lanceolata]|uniref:homer protein n=1 Tax=Tasmannia lanceolata TaxID=3420 RepID=UPI004062A4A4